MCRRHYKRAVRAGLPTEDRGRPISETISEIRTLMGSDSLRGIATRLGYRSRRGKPELTLYRVLHRAGEDDLWRRLRELEAA
jgi:hypothetical protein